MLTFTTSSGEILAASSWGTGPPVVLLHAGGERRDVWNPIASTLATSTRRRVIAVDQRGHGESTAVAGEHLDCFIDDVGRVLVHLGQPAALVGASLGGFAALGASARWPRAVTELVLVDVVPDLDPAGVRTYLATVAGGRFADTPLVTDILRRVPDLRQWAAAFTGPMLLVRGAGSHLPPHLADQLRELCPQLLVETIDDASHLVAQDQPHRLTEVLCAFLRSTAVDGTHGGLS